MSWIKRALRVAATCSRCGGPLNPVAECAYCDWMVGRR